MNIFTISLAIIIVLLIIGGLGTIAIPLSLLWFAIWHYNTPK